MYNWAAIACSWGGSSRPATRYSCSRQPQKSSTSPSRRSARPAKARWNAWLCALTSPGSAGPASRCTCGGGSDTPVVTCDHRPSAPASSSTACCQLPDSHAIGAHSIVSVIGRPPFKQGLNKCAQGRCQAPGSLRIDLVRRRFGHVAAPAHLELGRVYALGRSAVTSNNVTALEAAVDHVGEIALGLQRPRHCHSQRRRAARAIGGCQGPGHHATARQTRPVRADTVLIQLAPATSTTHPTHAVSRLHGVSML